MENITGSKRLLSNIDDTTTTPPAKKARVDDEPTTVSKKDEEKLCRRVYLLDDGKYLSMNIQEVVVIVADTIKISERVDKLLHEAADTSYEWTSEEVNWADVLLAAVDGSDPNADELLGKQDDWYLSRAYAEMEKLKKEDKIMITRFDQLIKMMKNGVDCVSMCFLGRSEVDCHSLLEEWQDKHPKEESEESEEEESDEEKV